MAAVSFGRKGSGQLEVMQKAGWKIDENEKGRPRNRFRNVSSKNKNYPACYIDVDEDDSESTDGADDSTKVYSNWCYLPNIVLEEVFSYLSPKERYYAGLVSSFMLFYIIH